MRQQNMYDTEQCPIHTILVSPPYTRPQLDTRISSLEEKIKKLDVDVVKLREQMKKSKPGTALYNSLKQRALHYLKQKKMYEGQRDQMMNQSFTLQQTQFTTQTMQDTMLQVGALKQAKQTMTQQLEQIKVDDIEDLQEDLQDMFEFNNEVQELLSRSFATPDGIDDDLLEQELMTLEADLGDELGEEAAPSYLSSASADLDLPSVPTTRPIASQQNTSIALNQNR
jgi:charged multivesicular body protein 5